MAQISGWRQQDWATTYQDGSGQWMQLEEEQTPYSQTVTAGSGAYSGGSGAAVNASSGSGAWVESPPPAAVRYVTVGYTEYGDPICAPANDPPVAAQTAAVSAPVQPTYATVAYTEYGDPICAPVDFPQTAPAQAAAVPLPAPITYATVGYTEYGDPICAPVDVPQTAMQTATALTVATITYATVGYTEYGDPICASVCAYTQSVAQSSVYEAPAPISAGLASEAANSLASATATTTESRAADSAHQQLNDQGSASTSEEGQPAAQGTRRQAQSYEGVAATSATSITATASSATAAAQATLTASSYQIGVCELLLRQPLVQEVVQQYCPVVPTTLPSNETTAALVSQFGQDLTCRMLQASNAIVGVLDAYLSAMDRAATQGPGAGGSGWVYVPGSAGQGESEYGARADSWRFDTVQFTADYAKGDSLASRAFASMHGEDGSFAKVTRTLHSIGEDVDVYTMTSGGIAVDSAQFKSVDVSEAGTELRWVPARFGNYSLVQVDLNAPPEMLDPKAVWFDDTLGLVTANENIVPKSTTAETVAVMVMVGVATWGIGTLICGAYGVATTGLVGGAILGATGAVIGGLFNDHLSFEDVVRGAVTGAIMGAVTERLNTVGVDPKTGAVDWVARVGVAGGKATVQGLLNVLTGDEFGEGFGRTFITSLADDIGKSINAAITDAAKNDHINADQVKAYRTLAHVVTTAFTALANPADPVLAGFAQTFLSDILKAEIPVPETRGTGRNGGTNAGTGQTDNGTTSTEGSVTSDPDVQRVTIYGNKLIKDDLGNQVEFDTQGFAYLNLANGGGTVMLGTLADDVRKDVLAGILPISVLLTQLRTSSGATLADVLYTGGRAAIGATAEAAAAASAAMWRSLTSIPLASMAVYGSAVFLRGDTPVDAILSMGNQLRFVEGANGVGTVQEFDRVELKWVPLRQSNVYNLGNYFAILSDEQIAKYRDPLSNPVTGDPVGGVPGKTTTDGLITNTPPYGTTEIQPSTTTSPTPESTTTDDLIVTRNPDGNPEKPEFVPSRTAPSGVIGGRAEGNRSVGLDGDRGIDRENEAADAAANAGYRVAQNPTLSPAQREANGIKATANPDLLIEGKVFDVKSPLSVAGAETAIGDAVADRQARRILINASDFGDPEAGARDLAARLRERPPEGLQEVKIIVHGVIRNIFP